MKILVVGGAGYIGAHMALCLTREGHEVVVCDNLSTGHRQALRYGKFYQCAVGDRAGLDAIFSAERIDAVMHFAASSIVAHSVTDPLSYYRNNVVNTVTLLDAMYAHGIHKLVFSSTAAVYGEPQQDIIDESHPLNPINPYGHSKAMAEQLIRDCTSAYGLRAVVLRYFNAAGADESGDIGESHHPETHLIPRLLKRAQGEALDVCIFGGDYPTVDGTCVRDYVHVNDLAHAHLKALHYLDATPGFSVFNLGGGVGYTVKQIVAAAEQVSGRRLNIDIAPRRAGDPARLVASNRSAREHLQWQPQTVSIEQIIASAWKWHQTPRY